jgi:hypothetical protein
MVVMTGKSSNRKNKFVIQLTPNYRIVIDRLNCTLMSKYTKDEVETFAEDEEIDSNYVALGYYSSVYPEHLVKNLIMDSLLKNASPKILKLNEFVDLFHKYTADLSERIGIPTKFADGLSQTIEEQAEIIDTLNKELRIMKGQITKLKGKR